MLGSRYCAVGRDLTPQAAPARRIGTLLTHRDVGITELRRVACSRSSVVAGAVRSLHSRGRLKIVVATSTHGGKPSWRIGEFKAFRGMDDHERCSVGRPLPAKIQRSLVRRSACLATPLRRRTFQIPPSLPVMTDHHLWKPTLPTNGADWASGTANSGYCPLRRRHECECDGECADQSTDSPAFRCRHSPQALSPCAAFPEVRGFSIHLSLKGTVGRVATRAPAPQVAKPANQANQANQASDAIGIPPLPEEWVGKQQLCTDARLRNRRKALLNRATPDAEAYS
jgi:hypothetical protein